MTDQPMDDQNSNQHQTPQRSLQVGDIAKLKVLRFMAFGAFVDGLELGDLLIPKKYLSGKESVGDFLRVFIHKDSDDRLIATTQLPKIQAGSFAYLKVTQVNQTGAFVDWGLDKELMIPFAEQRIPLDEERSYIVYCYLNQQDNRLVGSTKIDRWLIEFNKDLVRGQSVSLIIGPKTDLGYKVIVEQQYWGLIHHDDLFKPLNLGESHRGFVKSIGEDDKINIRLTDKVHTRSGEAQRILTYLQRTDQVSRLTEKSSPELIKQELHMSKAVFKRAIGLLYKQGVISLDKGLIRVVE